MTTDESASIRHTDALAAHYDQADLSAEIVAATPTNSSSAPAEPMDAFTVRLPTTLLDALRSRAVTENITTGQVIRRILEVAVSQDVDGDKAIPVHKLRALIADAR